MSIKNWKITPVMISLFALVISFTNFGILLYEKNKTSKLYLDQYISNIKNQRGSLIIFLKNIGNKTAKKIKLNFVLPSDLNKIKVISFNRNILDIAPKIINAKKTYNLSIPKLFPGEIIVIKLKVKDANKYMQIPYLYSIRSKEKKYTYYPKKINFLYRKTRKDLLNYIAHYDPNIRNFAIKELCKYPNKEYILNYTKKKITNLIFNEIYICLDLYKVLGILGGYNEINFLIQRIPKHNYSMDYYYASKTIVNIINKNQLKTKEIDKIITNYDKFIKSNISSGTPAAQVIIDIWFALLKVKSINANQERKLFERIIDYIESKNGIELFSRAISKLKKILSEKVEYLKKYPIIDRCISMFSIQFGENLKTFYLSDLFRKLRITKALPVLIKLMPNTKSLYYFGEINKTIEILLGVENKFFIHFKEYSKFDKKFKSAYQNRKKIAKEWQRVHKNVSKKL